MKPKQIKKISALIIAGIMGIAHVEGQTYGYGKLTVGGTPTCTATGTGGDCSDTYIGTSAGSINAGFRNTFIGNEAGKNNPDFVDNVAVGHRALYTQGGGGTFNTYNVAIGNFALNTNSPSASTNGIKNTAVGHNALYSNSTGTSNSVLGFEAMKNNTTSGQNVAVGFQALFTQSYNLTTTYNTAVGYQALYTNNPTGSNGIANTAMGHQALFLNETGRYNSAIGYEALYTNNADNNTANGSTALVSNTSGTQNTATGSGAMYSNTTGSYNTADGGEALHHNTSGSYNTASGKYAGYLTTGSENSFHGYHSGYTNTSGTYNTCMGYAADVSANNLSNAGSFGNNTVVTASNKIFFGDANVSGCYNVANVWAAQSDQRFKINVQEDVKGLAFINGLRPVTYNMDTKKLTEYITQNMPDSIRSKRLDGVDFTASTSKIHSGFIAQEVEQLMQNSGFTSSTIVIPPSNSTDPYALNYVEFVVPLVKAVQELSKTVDSLKAVGQNQRTMNSGNNGEKNVQDIKLALPDGATLGEPQPNPNSGNTQIPYYLPQNTTDAKIIFTDMLGKVMEEKALQSGYGLLNIDTQDLPGGVYSYSLVVNGKVVDSKKMMRNK